MAIPNIPGITTSVIDQSYIVPTTGAGRTVLLAGFSEFGPEEIIELTDQKIEPMLGSLNYKKYGLALFYSKGVLSRNNKVLFRRLLPDDATFANIGLGSELKTNSIPDITDRKVFDNYNTSNKLNFLAKARGNGYRQLFIKFSKATALEKLYATEEGDLHYKFNFLKADIYKKNINGVVSVSNSILFSLIDSDPQSGMPVLDMNTGKELFIEKKFGAVNKFIDSRMDPEYLRDLYTKLNIEEITDQAGQPRVILSDISTGKNFEVTIDSNGNFLLISTKDLEMLKDI